MISDLHFFLEPDACKALKSLFDSSRMPKHTWIPACAGMTEFGGIFSGSNSYQSRSVSLS